VASILGLFLATIPSVPAQSLAVGGIHGGILFDRATQSLRPMIGIPGSAYLGEPVLEHLILAVMAPGGMAALAVQQDGVVLIDFRSEPPAYFPLHGSIANVDRILWGGDSSAAILHSSSGQQLQWVRNTTESASLDPPIDLSSLPGRLSLLAVDSGARHAAVGSVDEERGGGLYLVTSGHSPQFVVNIGEPKAAVFGASGDLLYVADARTRQVLEVGLGAESPGQVRPRFTEQDGVTDPVGLSFAPDGKRLYLANGSDRNLLGYDLSGETPALRIALEIVPTGLEPLAGGRFLVNPGAASGESFWLLESRPVPEVVFVPAARIPTQ
jgi:hypothetical protein